MTPGGIATFFIDRLQHNAMRLLELGSVVGFLTLATVLPEGASRRDSPRPYLAGALFGAVLIGATFASPTIPEPVASATIAVVAAIIYSTSLRWLLAPSVIDPDEGPADPSRRRALVVIGAAAAGLAVGGTLLGRLAAKLRGPNTSVPLRTPDEVASTPVREQFPHVPGLSSEVTSVGDHYVVDIDVLDPIVEAGDWRLAVRGLVARPMDIDFTELQNRFRLIEQYSVLTCISNEVGGPLIGNSKWTGVRFAEVLESAGIDRRAVDVVFRCADGYHSSLPVAAALDPSVILAIAQNGEPLAWEHGFPCRVRAPSFYGVKNAKWLQTIEVGGQDDADYWTQRGWSDVAEVRTQSRIDTVGADLRARRATWVGGVAWAGNRGIAGVEVSLDEGDTWRESILGQPLSPFAWSRWAYRWTPDRPGQYRIACRATDGKGKLQDPSYRPTHPSGATGYHRVDAVVAPG